ncbi:hypothetical protein P9112_006444 [Eukaryota sp. TZLM1-RC]
MSSSSPHSAFTSFEALTHLANAYTTPDTSPIKKKSRIATAPVLSDQRTIFETTTSANKIIEDVKVLNSLIQQLLSGNYGSSSRHHLIGHVHKFLGNLYNLNDELSLISPEGLETTTTQTDITEIYTEPYKRTRKGRVTKELSEATSVGTALKEEEYLPDEEIYGADIDYDELIETSPRKKRRPVSAEKPPLKRPKKAMESHYCHRCGTTETPEWRKGPDGPKTLCNACGLAYSKRLKRTKMASQEEFRRLKQARDRAARLETTEVLTEPETVPMADKVAEKVENVEKRAEKSETSELGKLLAQQQSLFQEFW